MPLLLTLLGLLQDKTEWAVFPGFAIVIGLFFHEALLADGSITQLSGGTVTAIASASTSVTSVWLAIQWIPITLTVIMPFLIVVFKVGKGLSN